MKPLTFSILRILSDGNYHSGTVMGRTLNVSRASISTVLSDLDQLGLMIHKIRGRGYRWLNPIQWLEEKEIRQFLQGSAAALQIEVVDIAESTNSLLLQRAIRQRFSSQRTRQVLVTELQTQGRGRRGKAWVSGLGDSLTFSVLWPSQRAVHTMSGLSLAAGVAILRALTTLGLDDISLKWPNDVLLDSRKLAGILIELHGDMLSPGTAVIGIGLNVCLPAELKAQIGHEIADLAGVVTNLPDRNQLLAELLNELCSMLDVFEQHGFTPFREAWLQHHAYQNQAVQANFPDGSVKQGIATGLVADGALEISTAAGILQLRSGEVSLRHIK